MTVKIIGQKINIYQATGYIAGSADGIVSVIGQPVSRPIFLYEVTSGMALMTLVARQVSLVKGHYLFMGLDPAKRYLVMVRDLAPQGIEQHYEPYAYDYVVPATDLTLAEQLEFYKGWQRG